MKNLIILPDGTEISSGTTGENAVMSSTLTECVNSGKELTLGSVCAKMMELTVLTPKGGLNLTAGDEVTLYKVDDAGQRYKLGPYIIEQPTQPSARTMKLTGYDHVIKLDKDLTAWLKDLDGWPYDLLTFAGMVCKACGLTLTTEVIPNGDYPVQKFTRAPVTGRQLLGWIGEICARFVRADADGNVDFAWYTDSGVTIQAAGDNYYFAGSLSYENYQAAPIDAVQLRLADSDSGALWPEAAEGANSYVISGNPILMAAVTEDLLPYLQMIRQELEGVTYTPCKASFPARLDVRAGNTVRVVDKDGQAITAYVMTKTQKGQRDTLECTGSARRDSATVVNNKTPDQIAQEKIDGQTQKDIFDKLTNYGQIQGLYVQDGKWYINAELVKVINLIADHVESVKGTQTVKINGGEFSMSTEAGGSFNLSSDDDGYIQAIMRCPGDKNMILMLPGFMGMNAFAANNEYPGYVYMALDDSGKGYLQADYLKIGGKVTSTVIVSIEESSGFKYIKYSDGTAEGWGSATLSTVPVTTAWGNVFSSGANKITLPSVVNAVPDRCELCLLETSSGVLLDVAGAPTQTATQPFYFVSGTSKSGITAKVGYRVVWQWQ